MPIQNVDQEYLKNFTFGGPPLTLSKSAGGLSYGGSVLGASTGPSSLTNPLPTPTRSSNAQVSSNSDINSELDSALRALDSGKESLKDSLSSLNKYKSRSLSDLGTALEGAKSSVTNLKAQEQTNYENDVQNASETAKSVQRKNRNVLRSLGILGSSAAGEMLSQPYNEFDKQKATIATSYRQRTQQLDDFLVQKTNEHAGMVKDLEDKYSQLVGSIQKDLRFNAGERASAIKQASDALRERMSQIKAAQSSWVSNINQIKYNLGSELTNLSSYNSPTIDLGAIDSQSMMQDQNTDPSTVGISLTDEQKKRQYGLGY